MLKYKKVLFYLVLVKKEKYLMILKIVIKIMIIIINGRQFLKIKRSNYKKYN